MLGFSKQQQKAMKPGSLIMFSFSFTQNITYWAAPFYLVAIVFGKTWLLISLWYGELVRVFQRIRKRKNGRYSPGPTLEVAIKTSVQVPLNKTQQCTPNEIQRRLYISRHTHLTWPNDVHQWKTEGQSPLHGRTGEFNNKFTNEAKNSESQILRN